MVLGWRILLFFENFLKLHLLLSPLFFAATYFIWALGYDQKYFRLLTGALVATGLGLAIVGQSISLGLAMHVLAALCFIALLFWIRRQPARHFWLLPMLASLVVVSGGLLSFGPHYFLKPTKFADASDTQFLQKVRPILDRKCIKCHNPKMRLGDLDLTERENFYSAGKNQKIVVEGFEGKSSLYLRITESVFSARHMPYLAGELSREEKDAIRDWIIAGAATGERKIAAKLEAISTEHWSFQKFLKPAVPNTSFPSKNEIDHFLAAAFPKEIQIQPLAQERVWRNAKLAVTGLLPTVSELQQISQGHWEKLLKEALQSQSFAENISSLWFDLAGFADELGYDGTPAGDTKKYRAFVLDAFQKDMPYGEFLRRQLSVADQTDQKKAEILWNYLPRHKDPYITAEHGMNIVYTFGLGIEMRCARCHDHKYEPITNEDYYRSLKAFSGYYGFNDLASHKLRMKKNFPLAAGFLDLYSSQWPQKENLNGQDFADWLTNTKDGVGIFSARVYVDNVWRFIFGKGLVKFPGNFGSTSEEPKHLALLNWLTYDFLEHGASSKYLFEKILTSKFYQSEISGLPAELEIYGANRMRVETLRDNLLFISGMLNQNVKNVVERFDNLSIFMGDKNHPFHRRAVYFTRHRFDAFDAEFAKHFGMPLGFVSSAERKAKADMEEAGFFIQSKFFQHVVEELAKQNKEIFQRDPEKVIAHSYRAILSRNASAKELQFWKSFGTNQGELERFFQVLLSSSEFLYGREKVD